MQPKGGSRLSPVGWANGDTVYPFEPGTYKCSAEIYPGGPGPAQPGGTLWRFRYFSHLDVPAVVKDWKKNAFILRLPRGMKSVASSAPANNN